MRRGKPKPAIKRITLVRDQLLEFTNGCLIEVQPKVSGSQVRVRLRRVDFTNGSVAQHLDRVQEILGVEKRTPEN